MLVLVFGQDAIRSRKAGGVAHGHHVNPLMSYWVDSGYRVAVLSIAEAYVAAANLTKLVALPQICSTPTNLEL